MADPVHRTTELRTVVVTFDGFCAYHPFSGLNPSRGCAETAEDVRWKLGSKAIEDGWQAVGCEVTANVEVELAKAKS